MAYPKNYTSLHLTKELKQELRELQDFGNIGLPEKINQLMRFYKSRKDLK